jgi:hypothetical protein
MQKNLVSLTKIAIFLAPLFVSSVAGVAQAQEFQKSMYPLNKPGIYGVHAEQPLNTLLVDVDPQERWNLVYQQTPAIPMVSGIQFNSNLHAYVTQPETSLIIPTAMVTFAADHQATEAAAISTASATVDKNDISEEKIASPSAMITIDKSEHVASESAETAPTPKNAKPETPKAVALEASALDSLFDKYGQEYGVSASILKHIATCESGLRPEALSSNGLYGGLFQFVASTWSSNRGAIGLDPNPALRFNAEEAIRTAAYKISRGGIGAWPVCGKKATASSIASL